RRQFPGRTLALSFSASTIEWRKLRSATITAEVRRKSVPAGYRGIGGFLCAGARLDLRLPSRTLYKVGSLLVPSDFLPSEHRPALSDSELLPCGDLFQSLFGRRKLPWEGLFVPSKGSLVEGRRGRVWDRDERLSQAGPRPWPDFPTDPSAPSKG